MRDEPVGGALGSDLIGRFAEGKRLSLGENVGHQQVVMSADRVERLAETDEVARHKARALVDELVERVLAIGAGLAPVDLARVVVDTLAFQADGLAVAFHRELLEVGREALQVLVVRKHGHGFGAPEVAVPDGKQAHQRRQIALERRRAKVHIHLMEAVQHFAKVIRTDGQHGRQADGRIHRVAATHPVPELEHVAWIDAEPSHLCFVR